MAKQRMLCEQTHLNILSISELRDWDPKVSDDNPLESVAQIYSKVLSREQFRWSYTGSLNIIPSNDQLKQSYEYRKSICLLIYTKEKKKKNSNQIFNR